LGELEKSDAGKILKLPQSNGHVQKFSLRDDPWPKEYTSICEPDWISTSFIPISIALSPSFTDATACHCLPLQAPRRTTLCSARDVVRLVMQNLYCRSAIGSCFFSTVISFATTSSMRRWFVSTTALKTSILAWTWRLGAFHFCIDVCLEVPLRVQETCGE